MQLCCSECTATGGFIFDLVRFDFLWQDKNSDLSMKIEEGFGPNGLGILSVTDVRAKLLCIFYS